MTAHNPLTDATVHSVPRRSEDNAASQVLTVPIGAGSLPPIHTPTGEAGAPNLSTVLTADAHKMSGRTFLEALGLTSSEMREARRSREIERCIRAIKRGDTYGFPPVLVAECRHIMAMRSEVQL